MGISIRSMREEDLDQVLKIENISFTTPWSKASFTFELGSNPMSKYFLAEREGLVLGYAGIWFVVGECHVTTIAVDPKYRGEQVGKKLFSILEKEALKMQAHSMALEVRETNTVAKNLYKSFGLVEVGKRPNYYQDNNEDAIIMLKEFKDVL